jgi:TctA family transporter
MNWKNILERAAWTFVEGFLGGLTFSMEMDKTMLLAALMAGLSALKTLVLEIASSKTDP